MIGGDLTMAKKYREKRERGPMGRLLRGLYFFWVIGIAIWFGSAIGAISDNIDPAADPAAAETAVAVAGGLTGGAILFIGLIGCLVLGIGCLLTRGKKVLVEAE